MINIQSDISGETEYFFDFFLIHGRLGFTFMSYILGDISQKCDLWTISMCTSLCKIVEVQDNQN
jgi:hypothetical protein